jgi:hypothetical protein
MDVLMCFVKSVEKHAACGPIATLAVEEPEEDISTEKLAEIMSLACSREREKRDGLFRRVLLLLLCAAAERERKGERGKKGRIRNAEEDDSLRRRRV